MYLNCVCIWIVILLNETAAQVALSVTQITLYYFDNSVTTCKKLSELGQHNFALAHDQCDPSKIVDLFGSLSLDWPRCTWSIKPAAVQFLWYPLSILFPHLVGRVKWRVVYTVLFSGAHQHADTAAAATAGGVSELLDSLNAAIHQLSSSLTSQTQQQKQDMPYHHAAADHTSTVYPHHS